MITLHDLWQTLSTEPCPFLDQPIRRFCLHADQVQSGDVFVAVQGAQHDGHDYIERAYQQGAIFALGSKSLQHLRYLCVQNVQEALWHLAQKWRVQQSFPMITITGTVGKTSTKELLRLLLGRKYRVFATEGNQNNEWGVPLTLLNAPSDTEILIVEMGAAAPGDIQALVSWVKPTMGVITRIGLGHLLKMRDEVGVSRCKWEMVDSLPLGALAVLPWEDAQRFAWPLQDNISYVGKDAFWENQASDWHQASGTLCLKAFGERGHLVRSSVGAGFWHNALTAALVARTLGLALEEILQGLREYQPISGRGHILRHPVLNLNLVDQAYSANPTSMRAALEHMQTAPAPYAFVLADMLELGESSDVEHEKIWRLVEELRPAWVMTVGPSMRAVSRHSNLQVIEGKDAQMLYEYVRLFPVQTLLVKGSHAFGLEGWIKSLMEYQA